MGVDVFFYFQKGIVLKVRALKKKPMVNRAGGLCVGSYG